MAKMAAVDRSKFISTSQVGGIESYVIDEGAGRGVRALCVNTGGGLRYRILVDRGLDIDQAFFNSVSLTFLSHKGVTPPTRAVDRGLDWLKEFPVGLLTGCGPTHMGAPNVDEGEELGLHGPHSHTAASLESVIRPDVHRGVEEMSVTGVLIYGAFYGPCVELRRTISSRLGENVISVRDEFFNAGNTTTPHQWLLHINLGYPLVDEGAEFCYATDRVEPLAGHGPSEQWFGEGGEYKRVPGVMKEHAGSNSFVAYLYPKAGKDGRATVGIVNQKIGLGVAIRYDTREFPRCANWQHWGEREYVTALEPSTGTVEGRKRDRELGILRFLKPGEKRTYSYSIEVVEGKDEIEGLRKLNEQ